MFPKTVFGTVDGTGYALSIPLTEAKVDEAYYYDDYLFLQLPGFSEQAFQAGSVSAKGQRTGNRVRILGTDRYQYGLSGYDIKGREVRKESNNDLGGKDIVDTSYGYILPVTITRTHTAQNQSTVTEEYTYTYDHADRLLTTTHSLNGGTPVVLAACEYDELGRLKSTKPLNSDALKTQYTYNVRSWPKTISSPLFTETLSYEDGTTPCWNGNISSMTWNADTVLRSYDYQYDGLSRLTQADYQETDGLNAGRFSTSYGYDLHGNMTNIIRKGWNGSLSVLLQPYPKVEQILTEKRYGMLDSLSLSYTGNQLLSVRNHMGLPANVSHRRYNFVDGANKTVEYTYDANGNLSKDLNKGISSIAYNALNLPDSILFLSGVKTNYRYGADGTKLQVKYTTPALSTVGPTPILSAGGTVSVQGGQVPGGGIVGPIQLEDEITTFDYCGNLIYENGTLTTLLFDGGYVSFAKTGTGANTTYTPTYHFYMKDHLGSNRVVASAAGVAEQVNHYYPYGSTFYGETTTDHRFKYCGKELDKMHGLDWYDSSARYYDHVLGRFHQVDPLAEKYYSWSPYAYCMGNPMNSIDNIGLYPEMIMKKYSGGLLRADYYKLSNPAAHLLSLISSVDEQYIRNINIMSIGIGRLYPWYDPNKGGGAVTLGDDPHHATITLTKNYFEDDASKYDNNGYGQNIYAWFDILGHEVKHLDHIAESGNKLSYVVKFFGAYMKMGHDNVPEEKEADLCRNRFNDFYNHVSKIYGVDSFKKLFSEKADKEIIQTIDLWWNDFKNIK